MQAPFPFPFIQFSVVSNFYTKNYVNTCSEMKTYQDILIEKLILINTSYDI